MNTDFVADVHCMACGKPNGIHSEDQSMHCTLEIFAHPEYWSGPCRTCGSPPACGDDHPLLPVLALHTLTITKLYVCSCGASTALPEAMLEHLLDAIEVHNQAEAARLINSVDFGS